MPADPVRHARLVMQSLGYLSNGSGALLVALFTSWEREMYAVVAPIGGVWYPT